MVVSGRSFRTNNVHTLRVARKIAKNVRFCRVGQSGFSKFLKFIRFYQVRPQMLVDRQGAKSGFFALSESQAFEIAALPGNCKCERFFFMLLI